MLEHRLHLDFETYSGAPLPQCGAHKYARDPSTEVLMLAWAINDDPVQQWLPHVTPEMPPELATALADPNRSKVAYNAAFERLIFKHVLGIDIPAAQWFCTMVASFYLGFTGRLDDVLQQTGMQDRKDPRGGRLIHMFSKPAPKNHHARRYTSENRPAEFHEFCEYNVQDVVVERKLMHYLAQFPMMRDWDWGRYALDQRINDRGAYVDVAMAEGAVGMWQQERENLKQQLQELTGLPKATREPFKAWLAQHGLELEDMRKDTLAPLLDDEELGEIVKSALRLWMAKEAKAATKYNAVVRGADEDHRVRGMFQFKGASRTDRDAGRRLQLQNLKRSVVSTQLGMSNLARAIESGSPKLLEMVTGDSVSDALGYSIRHVVQAAPGNTMVACDLTSIESVVIGWLTQCEGINSIFREGKDTYKPFAARHFGIEYEEVTKAQRTFAKPPTLGCGFGLGWRGLIAYADAMGVKMDEEEAQSAVNTFRTMYPEIPVFWQWIEQAFKYTTTSGEPCSGYGLHLERDAEFLRIWLPSGRALSYHLPEIQKRVAPWSMVDTPFDFGNECPLTSVRAKYPHMCDAELAQAGLLQADQWLDNVSYMGTNLASKWERIYVHSGGITENCVQSIAYDILFSGIEKAEAAGIPVVTRIHDEIVVEVPESQAEQALATLQQCMTTRPEWAADMWLGADGYISKFYKKD